MRIIKETIDQIYQAIDIVEIVGDFVALKKRGANYMARSPFTNEKTPSFSVSPSKQIFKCFSTGKGGDAIKFLMEVDNLTYVEALKYVAKKYNIELKYDQQLTDLQQQEQSEKDALFIALNYAKDYYKNILLTNSDGIAIGLSYFKERGLNDKTIADFELGFALDGWDNFLKEAQIQQYSETVLQKAGLIKINENGKKFDFFRNRVMYPIHNITGKVVALAGRILTNEKGIAKYINSPETELYHKSQVLYGMFQAKQSIRNEDNCLLVEGYMDVISLYQAGITNAVASSGTSLTEEQVRLISRYTKNITVLYDGDAAGIKAAIRGTDLILDSGLNIKVVVFPQNEDPDSYVTKIGETAFREFLAASSKDFITFKTEVLLKDASNDPIKKSEVIHQIVESIAKVKDAIQRAVYFKRCSQLLDIEEQVVISEYNKIQLNNRKKNEKENDSHALDRAIDEVLPIESEEKLAAVSSNSSELAEKEIIRILIEYSNFPIDEQTPLYKAIFEFIEINQLKIQHQTYLRILTIFKAEVALNRVPGLDYFMNNPDKEIEQMLINLFSEKYELSLNWIDKFQIYVPEKDQDKFLLIDKSLTRLFFEKRKQDYKENQVLLQKINPENVDEIDLFLDKQLAIKRDLMNFASKLGVVISG